MRTLPIIVLSLTCFCIKAQVVVPPEPIDLRASYCIAALNSYIQMVESAIAQVPSPGQKDILKGELAASNGSRDRLRLYLMPRLPYLDATALLAAAKAAQNDSQRVSATVSQCPSDETENAACVASRVPELRTIQAKLKACRDLDWLPF